MKHLFTFFTLLIFTTSLHAREDFPEAERKAVAAEVQEMMAAFNNGNAELLVNKTHPALFKAVPVDEAAFKKSVLDAAKQIMDLGIKIDGLKVELPDRLYKAGKESVCFVPMSSVMTVGDKQIASTSFMIAAKGEAGEWKYLDGTMIKGNQDMLWTFFPDLPKDVELPVVEQSPVPAE